MEAIHKIDPNGECKEIYRKPIQGWVESLRGGDSKARGDAVQKLAQYRFPGFEILMNELQQNPDTSWLDDFRPVQDAEKEEAVIQDRSPELQEANNLALNRDTASDGISRMKQIANGYPEASEPWCLLAQALARNGSEEEAEKVLLDAFDKVLRKSNVADSLGYFYLNTKRDIGKGIQWYVLSIVAQNKKPKLWAPYLYLSGIYGEFGFRRITAGLQEQAAKVRGKPADLSSEWVEDLRMTQYLVQETAVTALLTRVWNEVLKKSLPEPFHTIEEQPVAGKLKPGPGETGYCQKCGKRGTQYQIFADRYFFLCSKSCENNYGTLRANALRLSEVTAMIDTTGTGVAAAVKAERQRAFDWISYCWHCGKIKKMGEDHCPVCGRQADVPVTDILQFLGSPAQKRHDFAAQGSCSACERILQPAEMKKDEATRKLEQAGAGMLFEKNTPNVMSGTAMKCNGCAAWICISCAEKAALTAGAGMILHLNCGGMFENPD